MCDLFRGQETCRTEFTVTRDPYAAQQNMPFAQNDLGIGNRLQLLDDELLADLGDIQIRNGLRLINAGTVQKHFNPYGGEDRVRRSCAALGTSARGTIERHRHRQARPHLQPHTRPTPGPVVHCV